MAPPEENKDAISAHVERQSEMAREYPNDLLDHYTNVYFDVDEGKRVLRKIYWPVLPLMLGAYFLQQLDKSSLSYTSVFNIQADAPLHGKQYSWLRSILYFAQLVMQSLGTMCGMAACHNFKQLLAARFVLGRFKGPSLVAVTQITAAWNAMNGITSIVCESVSPAAGKLHSYQVIFLYCDGLTLVFSVLFFIFFPDSLMEAKFWRQGERDIAIERLRASQMEAFPDPKSWCWFFLVMGISIPSGEIGTSGPLIAQSFDFDKFNTILFSIPFGVINIIAILGGGWLATHSKGANTTGDTKRKVTTGLVFVGIYTGNIIGPLLYSTEEKPYNRTVLISNLVMFIFVEVLVGFIMLYLKFLNGKHSRMRFAVGKSATIQDESMMRKADLQYLGKGQGNKLLLGRRIILLLTCRT
ncbi:MFS general substrate transporter [Hyaloscypha bicolor E]|uniref:MFS general substrate transporter n=1 Tax=Hyaloscypha bicolor E TaxID=1095630 RepID=A0A2J6TMD5_9HELO|nr:MFS general substrate transporter [Hyaloscypha bicolor E]PMD64142.1 MFS general substrate transporter [Hyaloscypha bicolor E]